MLDLNEQQIERYSRHIILPEVGGVGQEKILNAKVLIVGAGGLGSPCAFYLAAAGVGKIGLADSDYVDISNLNRQILHFNSDVGKQKTQSAQEKLEELNPEVEVVRYKDRLTSENVMSVIKDYDIVVDASDNFPTRYLMNDACVMAGKPLSHGAILRFDGQVMTIIPNEGPCYRCLFPEPPPRDAVPNCQQAGVLGSVAGIIGAIQATEVLKIIIEKGKLLKENMLVFNALDMNFRKVRVPKDKNCALCGENPTVKELIDYEEFCNV